VENDTNTEGNQETSERDTESRKGDKGSRIGVGVEPGLEERHQREQREWRVLE